MVVVLFRTPSTYLSRVTLEEQSHNTLSPDEWKIVKKTVKGVRKISPLFMKKRRCLMEALVVFNTLNKLGISSVINLGAKKEDKQLSAHAWVSVNGKIVIGGPVRGYEELIKTH